jgi:multiple sugar transport system permease protein
VLTLLASATLLPFALLLIGAASSDASILRSDFSSASFENFWHNLSRVNRLSEALWNTTVSCLILIATQLSSSILAAYAFAHFNFKAKKPLFALLIVSYLVPGVVTLLPLFFLVTSLGLKGNPVGLLLPLALFSPYAIVLLRQRFEAVPRELLDQAKLDGLGNFGILTKLLVPISRSFIVLLAVITFVSNWNAFLWPRLITGSSWPVISVAIASVRTQYDSHWNLVLAAVTAALIPALSTFVIARRNLIINPLEDVEL